MSISKLDRFPIPTARNQLLAAAGEISDAFNWRVLCLTDKALFKKNTKSFKELNNLVQLNIKDKSISPEKRKTLQNAWEVFTKVFETEIKISPTSKLLPPAKKKPKIIEKKPSNTQGNSCNKKTNEKTKVISSYPIENSHRNSNSFNIAQQEEDHDLNLGILLSHNEMQKNPKRTPTPQTETVPMHPVSSTLSTQIETTPRPISATAMLSVKITEEIASKIKEMLSERKNLTNDSPLCLPTEIIVHLFSHFKPQELAKFTPCKGWKEITRTLLFNGLTKYPDSKLIEIAEEHLNQGRRKSADFYASSLSEIKRQRFYDQVYITFSNRMRSKPASLFSRLNMTIGAASNKTNKRYFPEFLQLLSSHKEYKDIFLSPQPHQGLVDLYFDLLCTWAQTDLDPDSRCMPENAKFCFKNYERAKAFMHQATLHLNFIDCRRMLQRIASIPNLDSLTLGNIEKMKLILTFFQNSERIKFNFNKEFFNKVNEVIFLSYPFENLIQLVHEFPGEGHAHYRLLTKFILSSDIADFLPNDIEHIRDLVKTFIKNKMFSDTDMICIELLEKCMKILQGQDISFCDIAACEAYEIQVASIASSLSEHRQNISNFSTPNFTKK
jgi:hypothetical protein